MCITDTPIKKTCENVNVDSEQKNEVQFEKQVCGINNLLHEELINTS